MVEGQKLGAEPAGFRQPFWDSAVDERQEGLAPVIAPVPLEPAYGNRVGPLRRTVPRRRIPQTAQALSGAGGAVDHPELMPEGVIAGLNHMDGHQAGIGGGAGKGKTLNPGGTKNEGPALGPCDLLPEQALRAPAGVVAGTRCPAVAARRRRRIRHPGFAGSGAPGMGGFP